LTVHDHRNAQPEAWKMPPRLFDLTPNLLEGIRNALSTATPKELEGARLVSGFLFRFLDSPTEPQRDAFVVRGTPMPWRSVKVANLMWSWLSVRAALVGFIIFMARSCNSEVREEAEAAVASVSSQTGIPLPQPT
jgi:hypothetical protein